MDFSFWIQNKENALQQINLKRLYCLGENVLICLWWHLKEIFYELLKSRQDGQHCSEWMACWNRKHVFLGKEVDLWFCWVTAPIPMCQIQFHKGSKKWDGKFSYMVGYILPSCHQQMITWWLRGKLSKYLKEFVDSKPEWKFT